MTYLQYLNKTVQDDVQGPRRLPREVRVQGGHEEDGAVGGDVQLARNDVFTQT